MVTYPYLEDELSFSSRFLRSFLMVDDGFFDLGPIILDFGPISLLVTNNSYECHRCCHRCHRCCLRILHTSSLDLLSSWLVALLRNKNNVAQ